MVKEAESLVMMGSASTPDAEEHGLSTSAPLEKSGQKNAASRNRSNPLITSSAGECRGKDSKRVPRLAGTSTLDQAFTDHIAEQLLTIIIPPLKHMLPKAHERLEEQHQSAKKVRTTLQIRTIAARNDHRQPTSHLALTLLLGYSRRWLCPDPIFFIAR